MGAVAWYEQLKYASEIPLPLMGSVAPNSSILESPSNPFGFKKYRITKGLFRAPFTGEFAFEAQFGFSGPVSNGQSRGFVSIGTSRFSHSKVTQMCSEYSGSSREQIKSEWLSMKAGEYYFYEKHVYNWKNSIRGSRTFDKVYYRKPFESAEAEDVAHRLLLLRNSSIAGHFNSLLSHQFRPKCYRSCDKPHLEWKRDVKLLDTHKICGLGLHQHQVLGLITRHHVFRLLSR